MTKKVPEDVQKFIDAYFLLEVAGKKVVCPYFINTGGMLKDPVYAGKGTPSEIEYAANELLKNHGSLSGSLGVDDVRREMLENGLGVDCSGLVYQVLNVWLRDVANKGELKDFLPKQSLLSPRRYISRLVKPQSSVNADMFTSEPLSKRIEVKDIQPGDVIRTRGGKHILFVTEVEYDHDLKPIKITFVNSATYYQRNGVRYGYIYLNDDLNLSRSKWEDNDSNEPINYAYKGYRELIENNGVFRLSLPLYDDTTSI